MRINFDFRDLDAFLVLIETGSFGGAAELTGLSQSGLTRRIRKLEDALNTRLFERTTRSVRPTLAAKRLRIRAQSLVDEAREAQRELRDETAQFDFQNRDTVTIASVPSAIPGLVIPAVGLYMAGPGRSRLRILDLLANEVSEAVADKRADFGISSLPPMEEALIFEPLVEDGMVLTVLPEHPFAYGDAVRWAELRGQRLILPIQGSGNRALIDRALAQAGQALFWSYEVPRTSTALELVRAGLGIAALPLSAVPVAAEAGLVTRELVEPRISRQIGLIRRHDTALSKPAEWLRERIVADRKRE